MATFRHPRLRRLLPRLVVAIALGLAVAVVVDVARTGGVELWRARRFGPLGYEARGAAVAIADGRSLYLDCRGAGSPTVVLESGMGTGAEGWGAVLPVLAGETRTCAYDRAGIGRSPARGPHDAADVAADLGALLAAAGEPGPYILVAHSLGDVYARVFATGRDDVAGIVVVDGFTPDRFPSALLDLLGPLAPEYEAVLAGLWTLVGRVEDLDVAAAATQIAAADVRGIPLEILVAPRAEPRLDAATNAAIRDASAAAYEALSPGRVRLTTAWGAGHFIQYDRPDLVVEAVGRLVAASRSDR